MKSNAELLIALKPQHNQSGLPMLGYQNELVRCFDVIATHL